MEKKPETGAHLEVLLLTNTEGDTWETLIKPAKRAKVGHTYFFWGWPIASGGQGRIRTW